MCGIAGILDFSGARIEASRIERMVSVIHHRGPDAQGVETHGGVGLGHARLSIIDLSGGAQPMQSTRGDLVITFNGEIFNYLELREQLIQKGHQFATKSDTEVILNLFAEYGEDCVQHLNGQWAFAIWNKKEKTLFLSRDRMGIRPLFYTVAKNQLIFGSEIKALLTQPNVNKQIDLQALDQLFTFWSPLAGKTLFSDIHELPPGCSMTVKDGQIETRRYWQFQYAPDNSNRSADSWAEELQELLIDATRLRLRSDVPVGAYVSGGLDSSINAALIRRFSDAPLKTFSVTFADSDFDESEFQKDVIRSLDTEHHEIHCTYEDIGRVFPKIIQHTEKPVLRTAPAPMFLLSQLVNQNDFKVVLTGEGADEMFGGYDLFKESKIRRFWARDTNSRMRPLLLKRLYPYMKNLQAQSPAYLQAFFNVRPEDLDNQFFSHLPRWEMTSKIKCFYSDDVKQALQSSNPMAEFGQQLPSEFKNWPEFCQAQYLEASNLMPGYILSSQGDRMAMANSVEGRFPFLDHRVAEFAATLPISLKMKGLDEKHILKKAFGSFVPKTVSDRPKKPYRAPGALSFFNPETQSARFDYVEELLSAKKLAEFGLFNPSSVEKLLTKAKRGRAIGTKDNMAIVGILSTQLLVEQFVHGNIDTAETSVSNQQPCAAAAQ